MNAIAQQLPGIETGPWQVRNRTDDAAVALANRHYSREKRGSHQVAGPRFHLVLVTPDEQAVWITERNSPDAPRSRGTFDGLDAWRCSMFRNESDRLSSDLIREAMALTADLWAGYPPSDGWVTWVDRTKVRSVNPGACFKKAGWWLDRDWAHPRLIRLRAHISSSTSERG